MNFISKMKIPKPEQLRHHQFIFIEAPIDIVAELALEWGNSLWWPTDSQMKFVPIQTHPLEIGKQYRLEIKTPLKLGAQLEITQYTPRQFVQHTFCAGALIGQQQIALEERSNGTRLDYKIEYRVRGIINIVAWILYYEKKFQSGLGIILETIKNYSEKIYQERQETV